MATGEGREEAKGGLRIGVDSGGTFTDICLLNERTGDLSVWKVPSTPANPSLSIVKGTRDTLDLFGDQVGNASAVSYFGHGTTVATNALIQRRGALTGLITTRGFRDILELRRHKRPALYDIQADKTPPFVTRDLRIEVSERVLHDGSVHVPLDADEVRRAAIRLRDAGVGSIAICFLFSYVNPEHENLARRIVEETAPGIFVTTSHEVASERGEFERFSTTVMNAYVGPVIHSYLESLTPGLRSAGIGVMLNLIQSNGGIISAESAANYPVRTMLSGPAAGIIGAGALAQRAGYPDVVTFDVGGTSSDVSLIKDGQFTFSTEAELHGHPLKLPIIDIHTIGAGGGSVAYIDDGGLLKVGPRSAGAYPGPACYGHGNEEATVTDANVVLGVLGSETLLGGRLGIDANLAGQAVERLARKLKLDVPATALGIIQVVVANMAKAVRVVSVERGHDPRDFVLMAFGGAGPIHAAWLARELGISKVLVPRHPGILCATGLLVSDLRSNLSLTRTFPLAAESIPEIASGFDELLKSADEWLTQEAIPIQKRLVGRSLDMRYVGQGYDLNVRIPDDALSAKELVRIRAYFEEAYAQVYGYIASDDPVEITALRMEVIGEVAKADFVAAPPADGGAGEAFVGMRPVCLNAAEGYIDLPRYDRGKLGAGHRIAGPAIIEQMDSTVLVLKGQTATVDRYLNILLED